MRILKANTAVRLVVGPLCDKTTGLAKPSMTVTNMAMNMWHEHDDGSAPTKSIDAVSFTASGGNNDMVELAGGYYDIEITAAQLNITAGRCGFLIYDDDVILPYFEEWLVVPANVFDSIMGTDKLDINVAEMAAGIITATVIATGAIDADAIADNAIDAGAIATGAITNAKFAAGAIDAAAIATDAIDADSIKSDAITEIQNGLATPTNITAGTIATVTDVTNAVKISAGTGAGQLDFTSGVVKVNLVQILGTVLTETAGQIAAAFKKFFNVATPTGTVNSLPDAVAGANGGLPTTNGTKLNQTVDLTAGQSIAANGGTVATVTTLTNAPSDMAKESTLTAIKGATWTDETLVTIQAAADAATAPSAADVADAVWEEAIAGHTTGTTFGGKNQKVVPSETINDYKADVSALALEATLTAIKGATWTNETLTKIVADIAAISAGSGASVADILNALLASYTVSGSVGESLGRLDNIQAKTDLITTGTSLSIASAVVGSTITAHRGDTLSAALENIGALTNYSKIWFTVKRDYDDADSAAVIQIEKTGGLLYLNGAAGTAGNGSLTINDEATGDVTIVLNASETAKLNPGNYQYDIQILRSAGTPVSTLTYGEFVVAADVTKATA